MDILEQFALKHGFEQVNEAIGSSFAFQSVFFKKNDLYITDYDLVADRPLKGHDMCVFFNKKTRKQTLVSLEMIRDSMGAESYINDMALEAYIKKLLES